MSDETVVTLSNDQIAQAQAAFSKFDKRDQMRIATKDISGAMKELGHTLKGDWLDKVSDDIDPDGTGYIDFDIEFIFILKKKLQEDIDERELKEIFRILDKKRNGEIDVQEIRWILRSLGDDLTEEEIEDMILDTDTDGSGFVDYDEFAKLMND